MKINETSLTFLSRDCIQQFGAEKGAALFQMTEKAYQELLHHTDDRGSSVIRDHLQQNLLPPLAYYRTLRAQGFSQEQALKYVRQETRKAAAVKKDRMNSLARLPFAYTFYRMGVKKYMRQNFPNEGWQTEWVRRDRREIHFNLHRCLYRDIATEYGCPELCCVYCENDDIAFSGLLPKIRFQRTGTLAGGAPCCDFHFIRE